MLLRYINHQAFRLIDERELEIAGLRSKTDWIDRKENVKEFLINVVGPFPDKTPLNPQIMNVLEKENYRVEHIVYESQPGFFVTSSLFIPKQRKEKSPAVIYVPGHIENYRDSAYQLILHNLVAKGFIVYAFDPVSLGERIQYYDDAKKESFVGRATSEHSYAGTQSLISGISQARQMIWDGIRAIDYLCSREEVDTSRIGMVGSSGGGTQTAYIAAIDDRVLAAVPSNFITSLRRLLQSIGPQDAEQNVYGSISHGIDHADFITVRAPKPTMILSSTRDFFSIQGTLETVEEIKKAYEAFEKMENFAFYHDDVGHSVTQFKREKIYAFFQKHLNNPGISDEINIQPLKAVELQVTPTGQVSSSLGGETLFSLGSKHATHLANELQASRKNKNSHIKSVLLSARELTGYHEPSLDNKPVFAGRISHKHYQIEKYFIEGEGNYPVPYLLFVPEAPAGKALIYLHPSGKSSVNREEIEWVLSKGITVLIPDLPGTGETGRENQERPSLRTELFAATLISKSIVGFHATEIVKLTMLLKNHFGMEEIYAISVEELSPALLHAAAFSKEINGILLYKPYISYRSLATSQFYATEYSGSIVPYALTRYDLPDIAAAIAPGKLVYFNACGGEKLNHEKSEINEAMRNEINFIIDTYKNSNAENKITFLNTKSDNLSKSDLLIFLEQEE